MSNGSVTRFPRRRGVRGSVVRGRATGRRAASRRLRQPTAESAGGRLSWLSWLLLSLPGLAAVAALLFTWLQVGQADQQLRIVEQGQITDRFNRATNSLGSASMDVRLGGIYALHRIMTDSPRDRTTVISVLAAYVRRQAPVPTAPDVRADVSAAMNIVVSRDRGFDAGMGVDLMDLRAIDLRGWKPKYSDRNLSRRL